MNRVEQLQKDATKNFQENIQPGRISGIMLYFNGTNATGVAGTLANLGDVVIKREGRTIVNRDIETFAQINDIRAGKNKFSSASGGAFVATVFIPFFEMGLEQALNITGDSELNFSYETGDNTNFDSLTVTAFSQMSQKAELYEYYILGDDQTESGAVNARGYQLNQDNLTAIFVKDPDDVVKSLALRQNGEQRFSDQPWDVLEAGTLLDNRLEVQNFDTIEMQNFTLGEPLSYFNKNSVIQITTTGAGTVEITKCAIVPNNDFIRRISANG